MRTIAVAITVLGGITAAFGVAFGLAGGSFTLLTRAIIPLYGSSTSQQLVEGYLTYFKNTLIIPGIYTAVIGAGVAGLGCIGMNQTAPRRYG